MSSNHGVEAEVNIEVFSADTNDVYVRFSGFNSIEDAEKYADYLADTLPLLLSETKVMH